MTTLTKHPGPGLSTRMVAEVTERGKPSTGFSGIGDLKIARLSPASVPQPPLPFRPQTTPAGAPIHANGPATVGGGRCVGERPGAGLKRGD